MGLAWRLSGKESACQCRRHRFDPWVRKIGWVGGATPAFLPGKSDGEQSLVGCNPWEWKCQSLIRVQFFMTPWTLKESILSIHRAGLPFPSLRDLPDPGNRHVSPPSQAGSSPSEPSGTPWTEEPGGLQPTGGHKRVRHNLATKRTTISKTVSLQYILRTKLSGRYFAFDFLCFI